MHIRYIFQETLFAWTLSLRSIVKSKQRYTYRARRTIPVHPQNMRSKVFYSICYIRHLNDASACTDTGMSESKTLTHQTGLLEAGRSK